MILESLTCSAAEFEHETGWQLKPEGACLGDLCVPLDASVDSQTIDVGLLAGKLQMPLVKSESMDLWALGPRAGGRVLESATAPEMRLPTLDGTMFDLSTLRGQKIVVYAWAPY